MDRLPREPLPIYHMLKVIRLEDMQANINNRREWNQISDDYKVRFHRKYL